MKGYKVFNSDWTCRGFQYAVGETFIEIVTPRCCNAGFHFCADLKECFHYYAFDPDCKIAEVEALGEIDAAENGSKYCTNKIKIIRELSWEEALKIVNSGRGNTGLGNSGNKNSGSYNSGAGNTGNRNSGNYNSGDGNTGVWNSGDDNSGNYNSNNNNLGSCNSGHNNLGRSNSGDYNSGNYNSGGYNLGRYNSGNFNLGYFNSGHCNSGGYNSGDFNSGSYNSGYWNKTNYSNGCFNTEEPKILMFNKPSNWTLQDWLNSKARYLLNKIGYQNCIWIDLYHMTDEEKAQHPEYKTTRGYLKKDDKTKYSQNWWKDLTDFNKNVIKSLPNFDADIFKEITGIDVTI